MLLCGQARDYETPPSLSDSLRRRYSHLPDSLGARYREPRDRSSPPEDHTPAAFRVTVRAHEIPHRTASTLITRNIRRHASWPASRAPHQLQHLRPLAGRRDNNYGPSSPSSSYRVRQRRAPGQWNRLPPEQVIARERADARMPRQSNCAKSLVCAVAHAVQRDWARFFLQSAPDRLL